MGQLTCQYATVHGLGLIRKIDDHGDVAEWIDAAGAAAFADSGQNHVNIRLPILMEYHGAAARIDPGHGGGRINLRGVYHFPNDTRAAPTVDAVHFSETAVHQCGPVTMLEAESIVRVDPDSDDSTLKIEPGSQNHRDGNQRDDYFRAHLF